MLPAFQKIIVNRKLICWILKSATLSLAGVQKLTCNSKKQLFIKSNGFDLASFEKLSTNSKANDA
jgi:hypothetical protein